MTTYDPDTTEQDPGVLRDIVRRFQGRLCLNATVNRAGRGSVSIDNAEAEGGRLLSRRAAYHA